MNKTLYQEREVSEITELCDERGRLRYDSVGWSRNPVFRCNLSGHWLRKKKWNYWCITSRECLFSVTISNIDYAGMVFVYFLDFNTQKFIEKTIMTPFGAGCSMPEEVNETVEFDDRRLKLVFKKEDGCVNITSQCSDFGGMPMEADLKIVYPQGYETLNVVVPWNKNRFQFTSKHEGLPVEGRLRVGENTYGFSQGNGFACLDFGRGIWPYKVSWNWANASGISNGRLIGLNLGAKWTDGTGVTENGFFIDGRLTKLSEDVIFDYDKTDLMKPWTIKTGITGRVDLKFVPIYERVAKTNLVILKSEVHQLIGYLSGTITSDADETIIIDRFVGAVEDHFGQW